MELDQYAAFEAGNFTIAQQEGSPIKALSLACMSFLSTYSDLEKNLYAAWKVENVACETATATARRSARKAYAGLRDGYVVIQGVAGSYGLQLPASVREAADVVTERMAELR
jgi:hypothetical protein